MARYTGAVCRLCRREDMKLFLKGERCYTDKCGYERRSYPPGQHGQSRRRKRSNYGEQLREKQKVKRIYGIAERQFRGYYYKAVRAKGVSSHILIQLLERRLDNVVYRMGFASDHSEARQLVRHGHFTINGKKVDIPSYLVRARDVIAVKEPSQKMARINESLAAVDRRGIPQWIELDKDNFRGAIKQLPSREDVTLPIREQLIIELYSK
ncbi:MAG: 30S ribosomal protein S4 [Proteobacteria bacterium]|nr:30S ribosomal protein S4 [Pseudomonadota bacterium]